MDNLHYTMSMINVYQMEYRRSEIEKDNSGQVRNGM